MATNREYNKNKVSVLVNGKRVECTPAEYNGPVEFKTITVPVKKPALSEFITHFRNDSKFSISQGDWMLIELDHIKLAYVTDKGSYFNVGIFGQVLQHNPIDPSSWIEPKSEK